MGCIEIKLMNLTGMKQTDKLQYEMYWNYCSPFLSHQFVLFYTWRCLSIHSCLWYFVFASVIRFQKIHFLRCARIPIVLCLAWHKEYSLSLSLEKQEKNFGWIYIVCYIIKVAAKETEIVVGFI